MNSMYDDENEQWSNKIRRIQKQRKNKTINEIISNTRER